MSVARTFLALTCAGALNLAAAGGAAGTGKAQGAAGAIELSSPDGSSCWGAAARCRSLVLPAVGPVPSTFSTGPQPVHLTGAAVAGRSQLSLSSSATARGTAGRSLANELYVEITAAGAPVYDGLLSDLIARSPYRLGTRCVLHDLEVELYAGGTTRTHGSGPARVTFTPASLTNAAQGGVVTVTLTLRHDEIAGRPGEDGLRGQTVLEPAKDQQPGHGCRPEE